MISYLAMLDDIWRSTALPKTIICISCSKQMLRNFYIFMGPIRHDNPCCNLKYRHMKHVVTSPIFGHASLEQHHTEIENATVISSEPVVNILLLRISFLHAITLKLKCHFDEIVVTIWSGIYHFNKFCYGQWKKRLLSVQRPNRDFFISTYLYIYDSWRIIFDDQNAKCHDYNQTFRH